MIDDVKQASDAALVVAIGRWHDEALKEAYRRHAGAVFSMARRILGDRARAEDMVQEVFLRLWNQPEKFDPGRGSLRSYLLAQAHGRSVDTLRSERSRQLREERDARGATEHCDELERHISDRAVARQVREAVAGLRDGERRAIELAYFGGHTYQETAAILREPEGTVKSRIRSGLRRLQSVLNDVGGAGAWESS